MNNPHQLTYRQHIFPRRSIARFCNDRGLVQVYLNGKQFPCNPENDLFCAQRVWNQQAENGFPGKIERDFQTVANAIIENNEVSPDHNGAISDFYALLHLRQHHAETPLPASKIELFEGLAVNYTQDERERLEANHITVPTNDGHFEATTMNGLMLMTQLVTNPIKDKAKSWGLLRLHPSVSLLVADRVARNLELPLTPELLLKANWPSQMLSEARSQRYNRVTKQECSRFYFGMHL